MSDNSRDKTLLENISRGDESALEELVSGFQSRIINLLYRYTRRSRQDAEELAQDVFVKVWNSAGSFRGGSAVSTWIYRIAINLAINHTKKKKLPVFSTDGYMASQAGGIRREFAVQEPSQQETLINKDRKEIIEHSMEKLPPSQKTALILSRYEGRSYSEISGIMKVSIPAVESLLFKAKRKLRTVLLPYREKGML